MKCSRFLSTAPHADTDGQAFPFQNRAWHSGFPYSSIILHHCNHHLPPQATNFPPHLLPLCSPGMWAGSRLNTRQFQLRKHNPHAPLPSSRGMWATPDHLGWQRISRGGNAVRGRKDRLGGHKVRSVVAHHEKRAMNDESHDPFFVFSSCYLHPTDSLLQLKRPHSLPTSPSTVICMQQRWVELTMVNPMTVSGPMRENRVQRRRIQPNDGARKLCLTWYLR